MEEEQRHTGKERARAKLRHHPNDAGGYLGRARHSKGELGFKLSKGGTHLVGRPLLHRILVDVDSPDGDAQRARECRVDDVREGALLYQERNGGYLRVVDAVARIVGIRHLRTEVERGRRKPVIGVGVGGLYDANDRHGDDAGGCRVWGDSQYIPRLQPKLAGGGRADHGLQDGGLRVDWILRTWEAPIDDGDVLVEVREAAEGCARGGSCREMRRGHGKRGNIRVEFDASHEAATPSVYPSEMIVHSLYECQIRVRHLLRRQRNVVGEREQLRLKSTQPVDFDVEREPLQGDEVNWYRSSEGGGEQDAHEDAGQQHPGVSDTAKDELGGRESGHAGKFGL